MAHSVASLEHFEPFWYITGCYRTEFVTMHVYQYCDCNSISKPCQIPFSPWHLQYNSRGVFHSFKLKSKKYQLYGIRCFCIKAIRNNKIYMKPKRRDKWEKWQQFTTLQCRQLRSRLPLLQASRLSTDEPRDSFEFAEIWSFNLNTGIIYKVKTKFNEFRLI